MLSKFDIREFDRLLAERNSHPSCVIMSPEIWNGYWYVDKKSIFSRFYKRLGRKLHSPRIYWLGLRIRWMTGLRYIIGLDLGEAELIDTKEYL